MRTSVAKVHWTQVCIYQNSIWNRVFILDLKSDANLEPVSALKLTQTRMFTAESFGSRYIKHWDSFNGKSMDSTTQLFGCMSLKSLPVICQQLQGLFVANLRLVLCCYMICHDRQPSNNDQPVVLQSRCVYKWARALPPRCKLARTACLPSAGIEAAIAASCVHICVTSSRRRSHKCCAAACNVVSYDTSLLVIEPAVNGHLLEPLAHAYGVQRQSPAVAVARRHTLSAVLTRHSLILPPEQTNYCHYYLAFK